MTYSYILLTTIPTSDRGKKNTHISISTLEQMEGLNTFFLLSTYLIFLTCYSAYKLKVEKVENPNSDLGESEGLLHVQCLEKIIYILVQIYVFDHLYMQNSSTSVRLDGEHFCK